jgi:hypothetical protein
VRRALRGTRYGARGADDVGVVVGEAECVKSRVQTHFCFGAVGVADARWLMGDGVKPSRSFRSSTSGSSLVRS